MSNIYDTFRSVQDKRKNCFDTRSAAFIEEGKLSKDVYHVRNQETIKVGLTYQYKEGPDEVMVYSFLDDDLRKGDYFILDNLNYLVYEDQKLIDGNLDHKKQRGVECNISFEFEGVNYLGYFVSTMRRYNNEDFQGKQLLSPDEKPIMMLPSNNSLTVNSEFKIEGKPWRIIEFDDITNKGITYYYLERGIIKHTPEVQPQALSVASAEPALPTLEALVEHVFETQNGIFSSLPKVDILQKTSNSVKFMIPFGIQEVTITTASETVIYEVIS